MSFTKEELVEVYKNTKEICSDFEIPKSNKLSYGPTFLSFEPLKGEIIIEPLDTVSTLIKYINDGKMAVLNMASNKRKGGGVEKGAMAQEECLFRCSNLFTISDEFYPLEVNEFIYTNDVTFVKSANYDKILPLTADVITIAALNMNVENKYYNVKDAKEGYEKIMSKKIQAMLDTAAINNCKNIILGAWGCGVFKNDPLTVANLFKKALETKKCMFEKVIFAVINDKNSVGNNYQIFYDTLHGL